MQRKCADFMEMLGRLLAVLVFVVVFFCFDIGSLFALNYGKSADGTCESSNLKLAVATENSNNRGADSEIYKKSALRDQENYENSRANNKSKTDNSVEFVIVQKGPDSCESSKFKMAVATENSNNCDTDLATKNNAIYKKFLSALNFSQDQDNYKNNQSQVEADKFSSSDFKDQVEGVYETLTIIRSSDAYGKTVVSSQSGSLHSKMKADIDEKNGKNLKEVEGSVLSSNSKKYDFIMKNLQNVNDAAYKLSVSNSAIKKQNALNSSNGLQNYWVAFHIGENLENKNESSGNMNRISFSSSHVQENALHTYHESAENRWNYGCGSNLEKASAADRKKSISLSETSASASSEN